MTDFLGPAGFEPGTNPAERRALFDVLRKIKVETDLNAAQQTEIDTLQTDLDAAEAELDLITFGVWTTFALDVIQGVSVSKNTSYSRYARIGRTVIYTFVFTTTSSGTSGQPVTVTIPFTAAAATALVGTGIIFDASSGLSYAGVWNATSAGGPIFLRGDWSAGTNWGASPALAIANGDSVYGHIIYEASS